jgi:hypothetical protein
LGYISIMWSFLSLSKYQKHYQKQWKAGGSSNKAPKQARGPQPSKCYFQFLVPLYCQTVLQILEKSHGQRIFIFLINSEVGIFYLYYIFCNFLMFGLLIYKSYYTFWINTSPSSAVIHATNIFFNLPLFTYFFIVS